jgi:hypothetical protein
VKKNTKIQLTFNELKNIVRDCLDTMLISEKKGERKTYADVIGYNLYKKGYITEMALHKKDFVTLLLDLKDQLIENWCLCAYCSLYDKTNDNFDHWCVEFMSYANKIKRCNLKGGNKQKVISETYLNKYDINTANMVYRIIRGKFNREQIDENLAKMVSKICSQNAAQIVNFLSNDEYDSDEYIIRTFI